MSKADSAGAPGRGRLVWPTVIATGALAVLLGLGIWQLARLQWKTALIETAEASLAQPATALPADLSIPQDHDFRHVTAHGTVASDGVLYLTGGSPTGRAGLRALTAMRLDGQADPVLVDLGWLTIDRKSEAITLPTGAISIDGVLRAPRAPNWLTPNNDPAGNAWKWLDLPAMAAALDVAAPAPVLLRAEQITGDDGAPLLVNLERGAITVDLRNDHLQYALTWFALALGLLVIYLLFVRRHLREGRQSKP